MEPSWRVSISISNVAGETLEVEFSVQDQIGNVKHVVASTWSIPCSCQKLLLDAEVLKDDDIIERILRLATIAAAGLSLTVVVSLDVVRSNMNCQDPSPEIRSKQRVFALRELGILGLKGGDASINIVVNSLEEKDERVCKAAMEALRSFAPKGNQQIIAALIPKLKHKRCNVKKVALGLLGELAEVGDRQVVYEIVTCFEQHVTSVGVPQAAIATLGAWALAGDQDYIVAEFTILTSNKSRSVRRAAVDALVKFGDLGIAIEISTWCKCLDDSQFEVRTASLKAIAKFAEKGDQEALKAVGDCVVDTVGRVRLAALCAISKLAEKGDPDALKAISFCVKDSELPVRLAALCAFAEIADAREPSIIKREPSIVPRDSSFVQQESFVQRDESLVLQLFGGDRGRSDSHDEEDGDNTSREEEQNEPAATRCAMM